MNVTNVNKRCQPRWNVAFIISKLNVPSLQNSHRGCKTNVSVCKLWSLASSKRQMWHKHANWIFFWWIGVIRRGWKLAVSWHSRGACWILFTEKWLHCSCQCWISRANIRCLGVWCHFYAWSTWREGMHMRCDILSAPVPGRTSTPRGSAVLRESTYFLSPHFLIQLRRFSKSGGSLRVRSKNRRRKGSESGGRLQSGSQGDKCILGELSC